VKPILVDTSFLVAAYKRQDEFHGPSMRVYETLSRPLVTCEPVIAEALHLLRFTRGAADSIFASIEQGILSLPFDLGQSAAMVRKILAKYQDVPADLADACLIQMADELDIGEILTLDSDFHKYRWRRNRAFDLLISLG
jgi:uncharacterized protein